MRNFIEKQKSIVTNYGKKCAVLALAGAICISATGCAVSKSIFDATNNSDVNTNGNAAGNTSNNVSGSSQSVNNKNAVNVDLSKVGSEYTVNEAGTYVLSGNLEGMLVVDAKGAEVCLVMDGVNIHNSKNAAVYVNKADKVTITLADSSHNSLSSDSFEALDENNIDGVIFCKSDLIIEGSGELNVDSSKATGHGIVCKDTLKLVSGTVNVVAKKTAIQANDLLEIEGANITLNAGTKGLHCDEVLNILGGNIKVAESNEGIEAKVINISGGDIDITSKDDGINASDGSGQQMGGGRGMAPFEAGKTPNEMEASVQLNISGGTVKINANGDGLDSNGNLAITGGVVYVSGPTTSGNGAIDKNGTGTINGGIIIAVGSAGMAETLTSTTQGVIQVSMSGNAGDVIKLLDEDGKVIIDWTAEKKFENVVISSPEIKKNGTYTVKVGDTTKDVTLDGLNYSEGGNVGGFGGRGGKAGFDGFGGAEGFGGFGDRSGAGEFDKGNRGNMMMPRDNGIL